VLAHLLLLMLAWQLRPPAPDTQDARRSSTVRLLPSPSTSRASTSSASASSRVAAPVAVPPFPMPTTLRTQVTLMVDPSEWAPPAPPAPSATPVSPAGSTRAADAGPFSAQVGLDGAARAPQGPASGPRRLAMKPSQEVLRGSLANPATQDPRTNTPRPSVEEKIALGLNPDLCLKEERLPDGTIRRYLAKRRVVPTAAQAYTQVKTERIAVCS
jgi:hypothetical protein